MCADLEGTSQWQKRTASNDSNWESCREGLLTAVLDSLVVPAEAVVCMFCQKECAVVRCLECKVQFLCSDCDDLVHNENPLHDRQDWLNGFFHYLTPLQSVSSERKIFIRGN